MKLKYEIPFVLFSNCLLTLGSKRSIILDTTKEEIKLIPNDLCKILTTYNGQTINHIKREYNNNFDKTIEDYFTFLLDNGFIFFTNNPHLFPRIRTKWLAPFAISNAIIDFNNLSSFDLEKTLIDLETLNCKHLQLRFFSIFLIKKIESLVNFLNERCSIIQNIDFFIPFSPKLNKEEVLDLIRKNGRIGNIIVYNSKFDEHTKVKNQSSLIFVSNSLKNEKYCGKIFPNNFVKNLPNFIEAKNHNSCLNGKISIDKEGYIKNCPSMSRNFGNIKDTSLHQALECKDFKNYWNITKDQIDVCKDCEFRYICTDCRAYKEKPEDDYSKPLKCGYNPYTNEWEEWSTNPIKQSAIEYYGMKELVKNND